MAENSLKSYMSKSKKQSYIDVSMHHLSEMIVEAAAWPEAAQTHLYALWSHLDQIDQLLTQPQLPARESRFYLSELEQEMSALKQLPLQEEARWHMNKLKKALIGLSHLIDERLSRSFEHPAIAINTMDTVEVHI